MFEASVVIFYRFYRELLDKDKSDMFDSRRTYVVEEVDYTDGGLL